jgi:hypothetical protein
LSDLGEVYRGQSPDGETREEDHNYNNREVKGLGESNDPGKERTEVGIAEEQRQERTVTFDRKENGRKRQSDPGRKGERESGDPGREERRYNDSWQGGGIESSDPG